jgi:hypothetical protein
MNNQTAEQMAEQLQGNRQLAIQALNCAANTKGFPESQYHMCYDHRLPVTGYRLLLLTEQLLYRNTPDFALGAPLCLLLTTF